MGNRNELVRALRYRAAAQLGDAILGDDRVGVASRRGDDPSAEARDDARDSAVACGRLHDDDPAAAGRLEAPAREITVAPDHPDDLTACDLSVYLAREIDLKGGVDAGQVRNCGVDEDVVGVARRALWSRAFRWAQR